jgi:chaperone LolA
MMKRMILATSVFFLQLFALEANDVLDRTIKQYQNMNSFYAEFEQVYCDEEAGICQRYEGKTYYMKPNFFRMEIDKPRQIYVGDSVSLWIYLPDEKRAIRQRLEQMPFQINPDALLKNYQAEYDAQIITETDDYYEIALVPKEDTDIYRKLTVKIDKAAFEINSITVLDEAGVESKFEFSKVEINKKISRKMFEFNPPEGIQIDEF